MIRLAATSAFQFSALRSGATSAVDTVANISEHATEAEKRVISYETDAYSVYNEGSYNKAPKPNYGPLARDIASDNRGAALKGVSNPKSKWWHPNYVDNLSETQTILGVKNVDKGLATIGSATENVATNTGKAWVGEGYKSITDNAGNVIGYSSSDGMRAFRIQYKPREGMWRANFTENYKYINEFGDITNK